MTAAFDNRPTAHYAGDHRAEVGQLAGPNAWGEVLVVTEVDYDADRDCSTARFSHATQPDADRHQAKAADVQRFLSHFTRPVSA